MLYYNSSHVSDVTGRSEGWTLPDYSVHDLLCLQSSLFYLQRCCNCQNLLPFNLDIQFRELINGNVLSVIRALL